MVTGHWSGKAPVRVLIVLTIMSLGCRDNGGDSAQADVGTFSSPERAESTAPTEQAQTPVADSLDLLSASDLGEAGQGTIPHPAGDPQNVVIGVADGDESQVFGRIWDVALDKQGDLYVLDNMTMNVRWFSQNGGYRGDAGRPGAGPGEFRAPIAIDVGADGQVLVLDMANRRLSRFLPTDSGLTRAGEVTIPAYGMDMCEVNGNLFLLTNDSAAIVTMLDSAGAVIRQFAPPIGTVPPRLSQHERILREGFARGRLFCSREHDRVVVVPRSLATIRAFDGLGNLVWSTRLGGYQEQQVAGDDDSFQYVPDPTTGRISTSEFVGSTNRGTIVVSVREKNWKARTDEGYAFYELGLADGKARRHANNSERIFVGHSRDRVVYFVNEPYPRVMINR